MARKKNQPIRTLTEKELKSTIESVPEERRALASNVVSELIWMSGMLDTLKIRPTKSAGSISSCRVNNPCCAKILH